MVSTWRVTVPSGYSMSMCVSCRSGIKRTTFAKKMLIDALHSHALPTCRLPLAHMHTLGVAQAVRSREHAVTRTPPLPGCRYYWERRHVAPYHK